MAKVVFRVVLARKPRKCTVRRHQRRLGVGHLLLPAHWLETRSIGLCLQSAFSRLAAIETGDKSPGVRFERHQYRFARCAPLLHRI